jgi:hypothetical protein
MRRSHLAVTAASFLLLTACAGSGSTTPTPAPATPAPATPAGAATTTACATVAPTLERWPTPGQASATGDLIPLIASSQIAAGPARILFTLIDSKNALLAGADVPVVASVYDLAADPAQPVVSVDAPFIDPGTGRGLYRVNAELTHEGDWGLEVQATIDGCIVASRAIFSVLEAGSVPSIGAEAPRSDSPTGTTPDEIARISTDDDPDPDFYSTSIAEAVGSGRPSAILFATPQFCQTAACGPMLDVLKGIAAEYKDQVTFVNVEPYRLRETPQGLQPDLDADGHLQPVQSVLEWGLPTEPWLFIVDADGRVFASFEGMLGEDEVRAALADVVAQSGGSVTSPAPAASPAASSAPLDSPEPAAS